MVELLTDLGPGGFRFGSAGQSFCGVDTMIVDPDPETGVGEIATRSRGVFMGYHRDPQATAAAFTPGGFFRGGDLGKLDAAGFLSVEGRLKELIVTSGGKNIGPAAVEAAVLASADLSDVLGATMVVGDGRRHLACLVTLKTEPFEAPKLARSARDWADRVVGQKTSNIVTIEDFIKSDWYGRFLQHIWEGIEEANEGAESNAHKIKKFRLVPGHFSVEGGELGPTMKLRRRVVAERYRDLVDTMYEK